MTMHVASSPSSDDAAAFISETHALLVQIEAELSAQWSAHLSVDPAVADQIADAARYVRKAAGALADQRLA